MPSRMIACSIALLAFTAAIVAGIIVGNPAITTLWRALLAMVFCYAVGSLVGLIAERALREHVEQYKRDYPLEAADRPPKDTAEAEGSASGELETPEGAQPSAGRSTGREGEASSSDDGASPAAAREPAVA